eukprot:1928627-Rhodomonas_salina.2
MAATPPNTTLLSAQMGTHLFRMSLDPLQFFLHLHSLEICCSCGHDDSLPTQHAVSAPRSACTYCRSFIAPCAMTVPDIA